MVKPDPRGFREDVVRVARNREPGVTLARVAKDFRIHEVTLSNWMRQAEGRNGVMEMKEAIAWPVIVALVLVPVILTVCVFLGLISLDQAGIAIGLMALGTVAARRLIR